MILATLRRAAAPVVLIAVAAAAVAAAETLPVQQLGQRTHIHGLAADPAAPGRLFIATHHGFFVATADGIATRVSAGTDDLMGFTAHPVLPGRFYASGHPAGGGNLGVVTSADSGRSWQPLAAGVGGPVDFHQLTVSRVDPSRLYGIHGGLQVSVDGGRSWRMVGPAPAGAIALAASARELDTLYAATRSGLLVSRDGGSAWTPAYPLARPATAVDVAADGTLRAWLLGVGLVAAREGAPAWTTLGRLDGDAAILHLAAGPDRLYAATDRGAILESADSGRSWRPFGSTPPAR